MADGLEAQRLAEATMVSMTTSKVVELIPGWQPDLRHDVSRTGSVLAPTMKLPARQTRVGNLAPSNDPRVPLASYRRHRNRRYHPRRCTVPDIDNPDLASERFAAEMR